MTEITFPVRVTCGGWSGDNDIDIEVSDEELEILRGAIADLEEEGWPYLDDDGPCADLFPRIMDAIVESLEDADLDIDLDDIEFSVGLPEIDTQEDEDETVVEINLDDLSSEDLKDHAAVSEAFKKYLMEVLDYEEWQAEFVVINDFANPYDTPFIMQDYEGDYEVDGKKYEVRSCYTNFCACGMFHLSWAKPFRFYMFIDQETLPDKTVGSYQNSRKLYVF